MYDRRVTQVIHGYCAEFDTAGPSTRDRSTHWTDPGSAWSYPSPSLDPLQTRRRGRSSAHGRRKACVKQALSTGAGADPGQSTRTSCTCCLKLLYRCRFREGRAERIEAFGPRDSSAIFGIEFFWTTRGERQRERPSSVLFWLRAHWSIRKHVWTGDAPHPSAGREGR